MERNQMSESNKDISALLRQALISHGINPDDAEIADEIARVMRIVTPFFPSPNCPLCLQPPFMAIGDTALCGNDECKTIFWNRAKSPDELLFNMGIVSLPEQGSGWQEFMDRPDS
jgi:hypothetical protein